MKVLQARVDPLVLWVCRELMVHQARLVLMAMTDPRAQAGPLVLAGLQARWDCRA